MWPLLDSLYERQALWNDVIPYIKQYGDSLGLQVCVVDMYHGMDLPAVQYETLPYLMEERGVYQLSLKEIQLSQETFSGPSLIVSQILRVEMLASYMNREKFPFT